jgi:hypothetical protein
VQVLADEHAGVPVLVAGGHLLDDHDPDHPQVGAGAGQALADRVRPDTARSGVDVPGAFRVLNRCPRS